MSKFSIYCLLLGAVFTVEPEIVKESVVVFMAVLIGTGAAVAFKSRTQPIRFNSIIASFFMGMFVGVMAREIAVAMDIERFKIMMIIAGAGIAEQLMTWFSKRYMGLFDSASKRAGLDPKDHDKEKE